MPQVILSNQLISYQGWNLEDGLGENLPAMVFLHGWRSQKELWFGLIEELRNLGLKNPILALDLPGFGGSPAPIETWNLDNYINLTKEFLQKVQRNEQKVILIGHSFGGRISIKLTAQNPSLIEQLVLIGSHGFVDQSINKKAIKTLAKLVKPIFSLKIMQPIRKQIYKQIGAEDYLATPQLQQIFVNVIDEDLTQFLPQIQAKTLLIYGENDKATPPIFGQKIHNLVANSQLHTLKGAGHYAFLDRKEEVAEFITKFVVNP